MIGSVENIGFGYEAKLHIPMDEVTMISTSTVNGYLAACRIALFLKGVGCKDEIKFYDVETDTYYTFEGERD